MSCVGKHAKVMETFSDRTCNVQPFNDTYDSMKNIQTVNAVFSHDTTDGRTFLLEVNQALDFTSSMEHSLLCPNQAWMYGTIIDETPQFLDLTGKSSHSVKPASSDVNIPLLMKGPISYIPVRHPSDEELEFCQRLVLTDPDTEWDPACMDGLFHVSSASASLHGEEKPAGICTDIESHLLYDNLLEQLVASINVQSISHSKVNSVCPEALAKLWRIPIHKAKLTLNATTHDSVTRHEGMFNKRYKTRVHHTRY